METQMGNGMKTGLLVAQRIEGHSVEDLALGFRTQATLRVVCGVLGIMSELRVYGALCLGRKVGFTDFSGILRTV